MAGEKMSIIDSIIRFFQRIKYHILLSFIIFVSFAVLGYLYPSVFQHLVQPVLNNMHQGVENGTVKLETMPLFINNFSVALNMIVGCFTLSVSTIYLLIYNALLVGYTGIFLPLHYYLSMTLPHGIFELTAIILAGASSFRLTQAILVFLLRLLNNDENSKPMKEHLKVSIYMAVDAILLIGLIMILLIIAAFIEANVTIPFTQLIFRI